MARMNWLEIDLDGLRKTLDRRGKEFIIYELLQNAWDEPCTEVSVKFDYDGTRRLGLLTVEDDSPEGFRNLSDAYTMFAESYKKGNPEQRGAFNVGEKYVLAMSNFASITTTKGRVWFADDGRHVSRGSSKREQGSVFYAEIPLLRREYDSMCEAMKRVIAPKQTIFNGEYDLFENPAGHLYRLSLKELVVSLPTVYADDEGVLRPTTRVTKVTLWDVALGDKARLYEMGIPVVETGDKWHVDVQQKVPLNIERDNVSPAYMRAVRVAVLNGMADVIQEKDATSNWVREAASDSRCSDESISRVLDLRFGEKRVSCDPSEPEANSLAVSKGYTVVMGGAMSGGEWENAKRAEAILPSSQVTPSPKPYSENGRPQVYVERSEWTLRMSDFHAFVLATSMLVIKRAVETRFTKDRAWGFRAAYGDGVLVVNVARVDFEFFSGFDRRKEWVELLIHEFGHERCSDHLSYEYHHALCEIGAAFTKTALDCPELWWEEVEDAKPETVRSA